MMVDGHIYPGHTCIWETWFHARIVHDEGRPYKKCELDHGKRGELEKMMHRSLWAGMGGPVLGIHNAITKILEMMEGEE